MAQIGDLEICDCCALVCGQVCGDCLDCGHLGGGQDDEDEEDGDDDDNDDDVDYDGMIRSRLAVV